MKENDEKTITCISEELPSFSEDSFKFYIRPKTNNKKEELKEKEFFINKKFSSDINKENQQKIKTDKIEKEEADLSIITKNINELFTLKSNKELSKSSTKKEKMNKDNSFFSDNEIQIKKNIQNRELDSNNLNIRLTNSVKYLINLDNVHSENKEINELQDKKSKFCIENYTKSFNNNSSKKINSKSICSRNSNENSKFNYTKLSRITPKSIFPQIVEVNNPKKVLGFIGNIIEEDEEYKKYNTNSHFNKIKFQEFINAIITIFSIISGLIYYDYIEDTMSNNKKLSLLASNSNFLSSTEQEGKSSSSSSFLISFCNEYKELNLQKTAFQTDKIIQIIQDNNQFNKKIIESILIFQELFNLVLSKEYLVFFFIF